MSEPVDIVVEMRRAAAQACDYAIEDGDMIIKSADLLNEWAVEVERLRVEIAEAHAVVGRLLRQNERYVYQTDTQDDPLIHRAIDFINKRKPK